MAIRRFDGPQKISDSLSALIKRFSRTDLMGVAALEDGWAELVGSEIAAHSRPTAIRGTALLITVDAPAWATQVRLQTGSLTDLFSSVAQQEIASIDCKVAR